MLDLHLLKTFLAVAAGLSFRKAAAALHMAPSTVTSRIKLLEEQAGQALFLRSGRTVQLTEQGLSLVRSARGLLDMEARARAALVGGQAEPDRLAVHISESLGIHFAPRILQELRRRFPHTRIVFSTRSQNGLARDIRHGLVDVGLIFSEPFSSEGVRAEALGTVPLAVIAAPGARLGSGGRVTARDLDGVPLVLTPHVWSARGQLELELARAGAVTPGVVECSSVEMVKRCVAEGLGASLVPRFAVAREARRGELSVLEWAGAAREVPALLVSDAGRGMSEAARAFAGAASECLKGEPGFFSPPATHR